MLTSLAKAFRQLPAPPFRRVLILGLAGTLFLYLCLYGAAAFGLSRLSLFDAGWANTLVDILGGVGVLLVSLALFPSVAVLVQGFLLDDVAAAVEKQHYPDLPAPRSQGSGEIAWGAIRFALITLAVNAAALPVYVVLLFVGIGAGLFYIVNGYLLAREYFELAAWRRMEPAAAEALRRAHSGRLWLLGLILAVISSLPLVNLIAPLLGAAAMVHEVEALRHRPASAKGRA